MSKLSDRHQQELQDRIEELEETLSRLKEKLREQRETQQHLAIDNLEGYLDEVDHKAESLKRFWLVITDEIRRLLDRKED